MTIYLRMLPLSLKHDDTTWGMVDDSWYGPSLFAWSFSCSASLTVMSFLLPRLHPSFLILLSCHLSTLRSFVGPSASPFVWWFNDLFSQMISYWWGLIRSVDQDLSLHLAFHGIIWSSRWGCDKLHVLLSSTSLWFLLILGWQDAVRWSCRLEFLHPWWMSCVFFSQSYWSSSCVLLYLQFEFISWPTQIELRVFCWG